jgi:hypothetical protein
MGNKIDAASEATDRILERLDEAQRVLGYPFHTHGMGVLRDPSALKRDIAAAIDSLQKAREILDKTDWPTAKDYDEV